VLSSWLDPSPPAMWRNETLAMVESSTSMKVASETTTAISHGLCRPAAERGRAAAALATAASWCAQGIETSGVTDIPGPTA